MQYRGERRKAVSPDAPPRIPYEKRIDFKSHCFHSPLRCCNHNPPVPGTQIQGDLSRPDLGQFQHCCGPVAARRNEYCSAAVRDYGGIELENQKDRHCGNNQEMERDANEEERHSAGVVGFEPTPGRFWRPLGCQLPDTPIISSPYAPCASGTSGSIFSIPVSALWFFCFSSSSS